MNWPDTREQSHLDTDTASMTAWILRALEVLRAPRRCGPVLFSVYPVVQLSTVRVSVSVRTSTWFFNRWERVFAWDGFGLSDDSWVGFVPDDVRAVVRDEVWQLVREAERVDRERMAARLARLRGGRQ